MAIDVSSTVARIYYTANGATTLFAVPFVFYANADLLVYVAGALKTITTDYTVAGAGAGAGGNVTFLVAPANLASVAIIRSATIQRSTQFATSGPFNTETLNRQINEVTIWSQENRDKLARALRQPDADPTAISALPAVAARMLKVMAFDSSGNPVASTQTLAAIEAGATTGAAAAAASAATAVAAAADAVASAAAAAASAGAVTVPIAIVSGGTGATDAATARANLGLGSVATLVAGTAANQVPQLDSLGRLPAVDGSQLTNLAGGSTQIVAGEALATRDLIYHDMFNQRGLGADRWYKVDTDATGPVQISPRIGVALAAISSGNSGSAQVRSGRLSGFSSLTAGQPVFAASTAGGVTQTVPAIPATGTQNASRRIGYAASATEIDFDPEDDTVFTARNTSLAVDGTITVQHWSDSGAREREQAAYLVQAQALSLVSGATGTNIGTFTEAGGLAAIFDSATNSTGTGSGRISIATGYAGKTYSPGKRVSQAVVWGSNNAGYVNAIEPNVTLVLRGKIGTAPSSRTDGTSLGSVTFVDTANESGNPRTIASNDISTVWDHVWIDFSHDGAVNLAFIAEIQITETTGTARDEPLTIGSPIANATATDRVNVRYDDGSGANPDTRTTFTNRTNATRDMAVEIVL